MRSTPKYEWGFLAGLSFFIACFALIDDSDQISIWIIHFVDSIPLEDFWKPYQLPPPANGEFGFRPLSVLFMKAYLHIVDVHAPIPRSMMFFKTLFSGIFFSWITLQWCMQYMPRGRAWFWTSIATLSGPHLFGLWLLSEFDGLGAAFILLALLYWKRQERTMQQSIVMMVSCICAMFLKESTALILFAMLCACTGQRWRNKQPVRKEIILLSTLILFWLVLAWELISGAQTSIVGQHPWQNRIPVLGFTAWQYLYFITPPAIVAIICSMLPIHTQKLGTRVSLVALLILPPIITYNHYESIYFSPLSLGIFSTSILYFFIVKELLLNNSIHALFVLSAQGALWFALIASSTPREDMAVRIFLPALPSLLILLDQKLSFLWNTTKTPKTTFLLIFCSIWPLCSISVNTLIERVWVAPKNHEGVHTLTTLSVQSNDLVLFNHFSMSLGNEIFLHKESFEISEKGLNTIFHTPDALRAVEQDILRDIMANPMCNRTHLFRTQVYPKAKIIEVLNDLDSRALIHAQWPPKMNYTPDHLTESYFPKVMWGFNLSEPLDIEQEYTNDRPIWTYWNARRPKYTIPNESKGDFSYTRRPMGALGLLHQFPKDYLPNHNFMEDQNTTQNTTKETTLQLLIKERGKLQYQSTQQYLQIPVFLHEVPQRILRKWPVIHWYQYQTQIHSVQH